MSGVGGIAVACFTMIIGCAACADFIGAEGTLFFAGLLSFLSSSLGHQSQSATAATIRSTTAMNGQFKPLNDHIDDAWAVWVSSFAPDTIEIGFEAASGVWEVGVERERTAIPARPRVRSF